MAPRHSTLCGREKSRPGTKPSGFWCKPTWTRGRGIPTRVAAIAAAIADVAVVIGVGTEASGAVIAAVSAAKVGASGTASVAAVKARGTDRGCSEGSEQDEVRL